MAHKVKANMKRKLIARQLSRFQIPSKTNPPAPEAGPSVPRSISPAQKPPTALSYNEDLFSGTESEMTEEEQLDFATPISSRSETPPPANVNDLRRCVTIMQEISAQDVALLKELTIVREVAAKLRKRARDVRDLMQAENGRRERMEAYFRYWQDIEPNWDRGWLYGEKMGPNGQGSNTDTTVPGEKPMLSQEQLRQKRDAIIARQEAEQRELEALQKREMRSDYSFTEGSSG